MNIDFFIDNLIELTKDNMNSVQSFKRLNESELNYKKDKDSWSVLECIEHLNRYGDFYIPEIKYRIEMSNFKKSINFKLGILGNYFANSMYPKQKLNKMKTFKVMDPINDLLGISVLDKFIYQQQQILELLIKAKETDLTKVRTSISISRLVKLRLGDTFRVLIYHNLRHVIQANNTIRR